ncbi:cadherin-like beta sandwich domain-containing protein [Micromonospora sp. PLK6-60]|uniref:cadherin-like beta sandwich domain-containing protein n=1 Tax=Micromonospora sp. PLK6-60 TaxID=2873383 RepID=UPI001CA7A8A6|nr:cadherin-like beta sandwich domain-containing protein [Micromonospora sp. PLK6-60]MBY8870239.1 cadherin-like beta sandwich domain-containing protein [Micromonospora sp. PLK6-60]
MSGSREKCLRVGDKELAGFSPTVLRYNALVPAGTQTVATVTAVANDPAATVRI